MLTAQPGRRARRVSVPGSRCPAPKDRKELPDPQAQPGLSELPGLLARKETLVPLVWRVHKVILGPQVRRVLTVRRVSRGLRVRMGNRVLTVRREQTEP